MASGCGSRAEGQPPALPVKQHRRSSVESDCVVLSPVGLHHHHYAYNDVFTEPTDCHAAQCPIHQRYDPYRHQVRFFSDGTPPPVPKKRLARTLSLPGTTAPSPSPLSPFSPLQRHPQHFDNPLYMMAPIADTCFQEEIEEMKADRKSPPVPALSFSQLSFDTPDEHLPRHFSSFADHRAVSHGIQHRHLLFLRSMAQNVEAGALLQGEATARDVSSFHPQDFLMSEGGEPKQIGGKIYYSLHSPQFPGRVLGLRLHKRTEETSSAHSRHWPSHVNVQHVIASFHPGSSLLRNTSQPQEACLPSESDCTPADPPGGSSTECATDSTSMSVSTVQCLLQKGYSVSVERDLPHATLEDFVQQSCECLDYDRRVCVLLLQILMGSHHLYSSSATAAELRPQDILLVWPAENNKPRPDAPEWRAGFTTRGEMEWEKTEDRGRLQMLWRTHGSPRVVLTPQPSPHSVPQSLTSIKFQIGALIQFCLHQQASPTLYRRGLLHLSSLLQSETGPQVTDMVALLQALLWGPRFPLFNHTGSTTTAVHNWLTIKRALLVMKLAERGLVQDQSELDWEDCMCLQYLSFTDSEAVVSASSQLC